MPRARAHRPGLPLVGDRLRDFLDNCPVPAFVKDAGGRVVHVNGRLEETFDVRLDDVRGRADFPGGNARDDLAAMASAEPASRPNVTTTPGGRTIYWLVTESPFTDGRGRPMYWGVASDTAVGCALGARLAEQLRAAEGLGVDPVGPAVITPPACPA
jgi:PAS domain-containing protein